MACIMKLGPVLRQTSTGYEVEAQRLNGDAATVTVPITCGTTKEMHKGELRTFTWTSQTWLDRNGLREWRAPRPLPLATAGASE